MSTLGEARTAAVMVLTWIGLLVLTIVAAPLTSRRLALIWSMAGLFLIVVLVPAARDFFALDPPPLIDWLAAFGIASLVWSFARLFVPGDRPVGPRTAEPPGGGSVQQPGARRRPHDHEGLADHVVDGDVSQAEP